MESPLLTRSEWNLVLADAKSIAKARDRDGRGPEVLTFNRVPAEGRKFFRAQVEVQIGAILLLRIARSRHEELISMPEDFERAMIWLLGDPAEVESMKELKAWRA